jgi:DNA sulfur modification protein DndC
MPKAKTSTSCYDQSGNAMAEEYLDELYIMVQELYLADNRPWILGYSGGKDSTATLQVVWLGLKRLPRKKLTKKVFIIFSDTLVETPVIVNHIDRMLARINQSALKQGLPFEAHKVTPQPGDTFWVNMIGRGYPAPYSRFRWCTDRLKIKPINRFVTEKVAAYGEVVMVLGARRAESANRAQSMNRRKKAGEHVFRHSELPNAWVFTPIEEWRSEEVWEYLLSTPSPWGHDNEKLLAIYKNAQENECPLVIDKTTPPCGNSRFGCWTCTVVARDTSMESMIDKGEKWMQPLLDFRDWLVTTQNPEMKKTIRDVRRRTGKVQYKKVGGTIKLIWGPYTFAFRKEILRRLLETQMAVQKNGPSPDEVLISEKELLKVRQLWFFEEGDWRDSLPQIYEKVTGKRLDVPKEDWSGMGGLEFQILQEICEEHNVSVNLLTELFDAERRQHGMSRRSAIHNDIDTILKKDWRTREEVLTEAEVGKKVGSQVHEDGLNNQAITSIR